MNQRKTKKELLSYKLERYTSWYNSLQRSERRTPAGTWIWGRIRWMSKAVADLKEVGEDRLPIEYLPKRPSAKMRAWISELEQKVEELKQQKSQI